eukprot:TRINITY_DN9896_c0_g1_i1.p1 TRINITY_DN9896_c0_g1~~TRINITY_DN9896_c0_g1_i1.p1  ORF type:complete len:718 (-),score=186.21 TRINITY_DN9896_c0_g1_i1:1083-3236(-)
MELSWQQVELLQLAALNPQTMRLLPMGKKKMQKVVVGDIEGVVSCFSIRKGEPVSVFRTIPLPKPVVRVELGGVKSDKHKIFVASGSSVRAFTKKGKEFFRLETNLTEPIRSMFVEGNGIWTGGEYIYNQFRDAQDNYFYMSPDRINDLTCEHASGGTELDAVLGCQDRYVRVIQRNDLFYENQVEGPVMTVFSYPNAEHSNERMLLYGTANGVLGMLNLQAMHMNQLWAVPNEKRLGAVQCISAADVTQDGHNDIVIGRDDGSVELYGVATGSASASPKLLFSQQLTESITSVAAGCVANPQFTEVTCASYSGRIISFTSEPINPARSNEYTAHRNTQQKEKKMKALKLEIQKIQEKLDKEKAKYQKVSGEMIAQKAQTTLKHAFQFADDGTYTLAVELDAPIDTVCLQADVPVELLDVSDSSTIVCQSPPDPENKNVLLATYRCQESLNRLQIRFRTVEGQYGVMNAYVIPVLSPKTCQSVSYPIKPLSQHTRVSAPQPMELEKRPLNELKIQGTFTLGEMHSWVALCLPEIPEKVTVDEILYHFKSAFLGTLLVCQYRKGEALFRSDNISTLSMIKEIISKEATRRNAVINIHFSLNDKSIPHILTLLHPLLDHQLTLSRQAQMIEAVKELKTQEEDAAFLSPDLQYVADHADQIAKEFALQPHKLQQLHGFVRDLYMDMYKFKNLNVRHKIPQLQQALGQYSLDALIAFFSAP